MAITNPFKGLPKWGIYTAVGGASVIGGYFVYRHHSETGSWNPWSASATATSATGADTTTSGTVTDPVTGTQYSDTAVDPETEMTYASEITQFGSVSAAEASVTDYGTSTGSEQAYDTGYNSVNATDETTTTSGQNIYTSDSSWSQAVQAGLTDVGYDSTTVAAALGAYLTGTPLTTAQVQIINTAIAEYGPAPVGNLQIIQAPATTTGTTTTSAKPTEGYPAPTGLTVKHSTGTTYTISWNTISGSTETGPTPSSYTVAIYNAATGATVSKTTVSTPDAAGSVGTTTVTLPKVTKSTKYNVQVWANGTTGIAPKNASTTITET